MRNKGRTLVPPSWNAIRTKDHLYVEYVTKERELYDMGADPNQLNNLLKRGAAPPPETPALRARLAQLRACAGPSCQVAEDGEPATAP